MKHDKLIAQLLVWALAFAAVICVVEFATATQAHGAIINNVTLSGNTLTVQAFDPSCTSAVHSTVAIDSVFVSIQGQPSVNYLSFCLRFNKTFTVPNGVRAKVTLNYWDTPLGGFKAYNYSFVGGS